MLGRQKVCASCRRRSRMWKSVWLLEQPTNAKCSDVRARNDTVPENGEIVLGCYIDRISRTSEIKHHTVQGIYHLNQSVEG